jgi:hypothetical protein
VSKAAPHRPESRPADLARFPFDTDRIRVGPGVEYPSFVTGLIQGVFDAKVHASIEQSQAYGGLMAGASASADHASSQAGREAAHTGQEAAQGHPAHGRQPLLLTMALMGINRIVVTDGKVPSQKLKHISHHSGPAAVQAALAGEVDTTLKGPVLLLRQIRSGRLTPLTVGGGKRLAKRVAGCPHRMATARISSSPSAAPAAISRSTSASPSAARATARARSTLRRLGAL